MTGQINIELLTKVWSLTLSANAGEAAAARDRARVMVERHGKTLADVPQLIGAHGIAMPDAPIFRRPTQQDDDRFWAGMRAERARMTPEQRAAAEALERYARSGAGLANRQWMNLSAAQRKALVALAQVGVEARRRKGTVFDLHDAAGAVVTSKVAMETSLSTLALQRLAVRIDADTYRISADGQRVVKLGQEGPPPGPYDTRSRTETNRGWKNIAAWCLANGRGLSEWETGMLQQVAAADAMPSWSRLGILSHLRQSIERQAGKRCPYNLDEAGSAAV